jgi:hypothetical protein
VHTQARGISAESTIIAKADLSALATRSIWRLTIHSEPGEPVGQGRDYSYTEDTGTFTGVGALDNGRNVYMNINYRQPDQWWYLYFSSRELGRELAPGVYLDAQRWPFQAPGHPGLSVVGHFGCNTITGQFTVLEAIYDYSPPQPRVLRFTATFEQHCDGMEPALRGTVQFISGSLLPTVTPQPTLTALPTATPTMPPTTTPPSANCLAYGIAELKHDDSQLFTINPFDGKIAALGPRHARRDLDGLGRHPATNTLYAISGDDSVFRGSLYRVDEQTGALVHMGRTGFDELTGLSFRPSDATLWSWSEGDGLIRIDTATAAASLVFPSGRDIESLAWSDNGSLLYLAARTNLWVYDPATNALTQVASDLPGIVAWLDMRPDGRLLIGFDRPGSASIAVYDVIARQIVETSSIATTYDEIEAIVWPSSCASTPHGPTEPTPTIMPSITPTPTSTPAPTTTPTATPPDAPPLAPLKPGLLFLPSIRR